MVAPIAGTLQDQITMLAGELGELNAISIPRAVPYGSFAANLPLKHIQQDDKSQLLADVYSSGR
jgi:hypothetical protein